VHAAPRLFGREKQFERPGVEAAHTTEQVELVAGANTRRIVLDRCGRRGAVDRLWHALHRSARAGIDRGKRIRSLNPILRARTLDVEHRRAQVAVVFERQANQ
jgi:hypothetical protein